ncbi:hypothetical protein ES702_04712 [subsurface metagenome]
MKNRLWALLAQQSEEIRGVVSGEKNIFGRKGLVLPEGEKKLVKAFLMTFRHLEERRKESSALVEKLYERLPSVQLIRTVPGLGKFLSVLVSGGNSGYRSIRGCGEVSCLCWGDSLDAQLCVQRRLTCSAGVSPARAKARNPVAWTAGRRETDGLKLIDKAIFRMGI